MIYVVYSCSASAVQEVAFKETQELLKQESLEVATLKVCYSSCILSSLLGPNYIRLSLTWSIRLKTQSTLRN